jgi:hypothetical protein
MKIFMVATVRASWEIQYECCHCLNSGNLPWPNENIIFKWQPAPSCQYHHARTTVRAYDGIFDFCGSALPCAYKTIYANSHKNSVGKMRLNSTFINLIEFVEDNFTYLF